MEKNEFLLGQANGILRSAIVILDSDDLSNCWPPCQRAIDCEDSDLATWCEPCASWKVVRECRERLRDALGSLR